MHTNLEKRNFNSNMTKQHFSTKIFKVYLKCMAHHYPKVSLEKLCSRAGLPLEYIMDETNWVSALFDRNFTKECIRSTNDPMLPYKSGQMSLTEEGVGSLLFYLVKYTLSTRGIYRTISAQCENFSKIMSMTVEEEKKEFIHIKYQPVNLDSLNTEEKNALCENLDNIYQNTVGYIESIPTVHGQKRATVEHSTKQDRNGIPELHLLVRYSDKKPIYRIAGVLLAVVALVIVFGQTWPFQLRAVVISEFALKVGIFGALSLTLIIYFLIKKLLRQKQVHREAQRTINKLDNQYRDLQKAKEILNESEEKYRSIMESMKADVYICSHDFRIEYMNSFMIQRIGHDASGERCHKAVYNLDEKCPWCTHEKVMRGENAEAELLTPNDGRMYHASNSPIFHTDGLVSKLTILQDITSHRSLERKYRTLFQEMLDGFALHEIICNEKGDPVDYRYLTVNPAFERMTGMKEKDVVGKTVLEIMPDIEPHWIQTYGRVALSGEPAFFEDYSRAMNKYFQVTAFQPEPNQFACIFVDVTEMKKVHEEKQRLETQLQQSQKMEAIGTLAGGIAHDFNNILFPIIGYTEMMLEKAPEDGDSWKNLNEILKSSLRARDLVQQILAFSRQSDKEMKPVKMQLIVSEVIKLIRATLPSTITIKQNIDKKSGMVMANPTHIHQIAMNLVTNAYHAMEKNGGTLTIKLSEVDISMADIKGFDLDPGVFICFSVSDTGHGIEKHILDRVFEPYFTTKEEGKGTGLGLSVVHGIVKSYKGDIRVYSESGRGSTFNVYLPVINSEIEETSPIHPSHVPGGDEHILLVDDEEPILRMEKLMLERLGYKVTSRTSSTEALEAFRSSPKKFDLVMTDMTMPNMTGEKLTFEIKKIREKTPVIVCTGFSEKISTEKADRLGIDVFLMKPLVKSELAKAIRSVLNEERSL